MAKILLVDDAAFMRKVVRDTLSKNGYNDLYEAVDGADAVEKYSEISPDLVIMDIGLPTIDGINATRKIKEVNPNIKVLMYTSREEEDDIIDSFQAGADGYITKGSSSEQTINAVLAVSQGVAWLDPAIAKVVLSNIKKTAIVPEKKGEIDYKRGKNLYGLTEREMEVLSLIVDGHSNPQISEKLVISISTTKTHVHSILQKLYVKSRSKAISMAMQEGLV